MDELIPIVAILMVFGIPMVAILTHHQRKMAELIHGKNQENQTTGQMLHEVHQLRQEVERLRQSVNEQRIEMDDIRDLATGAGKSVADRLNEDQV